MTDPDKDRIMRVAMLGVVIFWLGAFMAAGVAAHNYGFALLSACCGVGAILRTIRQ